jgi:type III polyketide synthase
MLPYYQLSEGTSNALSSRDFDWAVHPGGLTIIKGAQKAMNLSDDQVRASSEVYKTRGNTASVTILSVLDKLRNMGEGRDHVVACSFGPGLTIEMVTMRRCRKAA